MPAREARGDDAQLGREARPRRHERSPSCAATPCAIALATGAARSFRCWTLTVCGSAESSGTARGVHGRRRPVTSARSTPERSWMSLSRSRRSAARGSSHRARGVSAQRPRRPGREPRCCGSRRPRSCHRRRTCRGCPWWESSTASIASEHAGGTRAGWSESDGFGRICSRRCGQVDDLERDDQRIAEEAWPNSLLQEQDQSGGGPSANLAPDRAESLDARWIPARGLERTSRSDWHGHTAA